MNCLGEVERTRHRLDGSRASRSRLRLVALTGSNDRAVRGLQVEAELADLIYPISDLAAIVFALGIRRLLTQGVG